MTAINAAINCYLEAKSVSSGILPLFLQAPGTGLLNENIPLYLSGAYSIAQNNITLFLQNNYAENNVPLFIRGLSLSDAENTAGIPLTSNIPLFMSRIEAVDSVIPLYVRGTDINSSGYITLFMEGVSGITTSNITLFMTGNAIITNPLNLYTHGF